MAGNKMQLEDWLDDLCVRFIINLPQEDLSSVARICFQVEEAQWFYEDFIRPLDPTLPSMTLRNFCLRIFRHCPLLAPFSIENHMMAFEEFLQYKTRVPVRGAILLNEDMDSTVLVKGWKKAANWSFPRGKINKDEDDLDCAVREVYEETGFDIREAGLVPKDEEVKYIEISMREQQIRLYVFRDVPMDTNFQPRTRKEISKIQWYKLSELPAFRKKGNHQPNNAAAASNANRFYMVAPFLVPLKKWVVQQKKKDVTRTSSSLQPPSHALEEPPTEDDIATQAAPTHGVSTAPDVLERATRELQRLLKVQPPTQGIQVSRPGAEAGIGSKGEALMAMLQSKGSAQGAPVPPYPPNLPSGDRPPHTPLDLVYANAPQPRTPHHHHPLQILPRNTHEQPPNFPAMARNEYPTTYYGQPGAPAQVPPGQLGHAQNHNAPYMTQPGASSRRDPALQHPQPPPQMSSHSTLLLNTLKGGAARGAQSGPAPPVGPTPEARTSQADHHGQLHSTNLPSLRAQRSLGLPIPTLTTQSAQLSLDGTVQSTTQAVSVSSARSSLPTDKHRSALLDLFKKQPPPGSPTNSEATARLDKEQAGFPPHVDDAADGPPKPVSNLAAVGASAQSGGSPVVASPGPSLPHKAFQLLSRPRQGGRQSSPKPNRAARPGGSPANHSEKQTGHRGMPSPNAFARLGQQPGGSEKGKDSRAPSFGRAGSTPYALPHYQAMSSPPNPPVFPAAGVLQHRKESNAEQKEKLLSLFGKQQPPSSPLAGPDKGKAVIRPPAINAASRAASFASASGDIAQGSRRGSQTPISPADRNFLLGYLQSVSSKTH